ncbi:hypothetical protein MKY84_08520 [Chryseomicrobium sp. FSL W7-1435]|uniref:hypothetical protein n=1 Tax=Chryseomicrobium sp. FSL W7-1435 TaxID=2921704 RepID=UPI00315A24FE
MKNIILFVLGFVLTIALLPLLYQAGVPRLSDFLSAVFGDNKILGVTFSLILMSVVIGFTIFIAKKNNSVKEV